MNKRDFIKILGGAAPALFLPHIIKPNWKIITPKKIEVTYLTHSLNLCHPFPSYGDLNAPIESPFKTYISDYNKERDRMVDYFMRKKVQFFRHIKTDFDKKTTDEVWDTIYDKKYIYA